MQQDAVVIVFGMKKIKQNIKDKYDNEADDKKLHPDILCINKINDAEQRVEEDDSPDNIIGLVPGFF